MKHRLSVILADDHLVVRMGIASILSFEKDITVVGEADTGREAAELCKKLHPDVVLMDLRMPEMNGAEATTEIIRANPSTKVLLLTSFAAAPELRTALRAGASGALVKSSSQKEIVAAIRKVASGQKVFSEEIEAHAASVANTPDKLTPRQSDVLNLVARGFTNRDVAKILGIGMESVKGYLKTIFQRLNVANRAEAVSIAKDEKLLDP